MEQPLWQEILVSPGEHDRLWELFHENSKLNRYQQGLSNDDIIARMKEFHESLPFEGYPVTNLPTSLTALDARLDASIISRNSTQQMTPTLLTVENLATLLHYAYGVSRDNTDTKFPRPLRVVPSGGALYPLEIFFHSPHIAGLQAGLYHYNPSQNNIRLLREGDSTQKIADAMTAPNVSIALGASLSIFITALFKRSVFKYGDRGYRFVLLEAGHVAQNLNLISNALKLGCLNIGGFFDRQIDDFLNLDGVTHSTIYMVMVGSKP